MIFKTVQIQKCIGYILPENIFVINNGKKIKLSKGIKINQKIKNILIANGFKKISGFLLSENDLDENKASDLIAKTICKNKFNNLDYKNLNTGRSNIYSTKSGLFIYKTNNLIKLNNNSKIAISAIRPFSKVEQNQELITAKVIPYGINKKLLQKNNQRLKDTFKVVPFQNKKIVLIQTFNKKINEKLIIKSRKVTQKRLELCGIKKIKEIVIPHELNILCDKIKVCINQNIDVILIIGPHAITHIKDIIPSAISISGAKIIRFGIPVEPGNLLLLSKFKSSFKSSNKDIFIIGMPSCAKSPKENGFDWVLWRILCNIDFKNSNLDELSIGGLIK